MKSENNINEIEEIANQNEETQQNETTVQGDKIEAESCDNLIDKKRAFLNSISDNKAGNIFVFTGTVQGGVNLKEIAHNVTTSTSSVSITYDLSDADQFAQFAETQKGSECFAVAIILCVFEYVELSDLQELKTKLLDELPSEVNENGEEIRIRQNPYLSINTILKTINGKLYETDFDENCIGLGKSRAEALKNLWQQFPMIRNNIARWLISVSEVYEYRTGFDTTQITSAFVNIIKTDFNAGASAFFNRLSSNQNTYWLLAFIAECLYRDSSCRKRILPYMNNWADTRSEWKWKTVIHIYSRIESSEMSRYFEEKVQTTLKWRVSTLEFRSSHIDDLLYISMLANDSGKLRTLLSSLIYELYISSDHNAKLRVCLLYLELLRCGYYFVSQNCVGLPLVVCDNYPQLNNVSEIVAFVIQNYHLRNMLFKILSSYLYEISEYEMTESTLKRLLAFFKSMVKLSKIFKDDIIIFLHNCKCKVANQILAGLYLKAGETDEK